MVDAEFDFVPKTGAILSFGVKLGNRITILSQVCAQISMTYKWLKEADNPLENIHCIGYILRA